MNSEKMPITVAGYRKILAEFDFLKNKERPIVVKTIEWARSNGDLSENGDYIYAKKKLREIDSRLEYLSKRIQNYQVIDPETLSSDKVTFGASVKVFDFSLNCEKVFKIVGEDESDPSHGKISYLSPIAKALIGKKSGDLVEVKTPKGSVEFEILEIAFEKID